MRMRFRMGLVAAALGLVTASVPARLTATPPVAPAPVRYRMAPFGQVTVYRPAGAPKGVALFLSGDGGWDSHVVQIARAMADQGVMVAGVSTPALMKAMEASKSKCMNANYPLVDLSRDVQHRMGVRAYMKPIIIGYSAGATLAYASLAQWPNGAYRGVVSLAFSADMAGAKPWCKVPGFVATPIGKPGSTSASKSAGTSVSKSAGGWLFAPNPKVKVPWVVLQGQQDQVVDPGFAHDFVPRVPGARLIELPTVGHGFAAKSQWGPQLRAAIAPMIRPTFARGHGYASVPDMPLTIVPATRASKAGLMAVIYSGDGGWVGIDRDVAGQLASAGIPVVGVDSLSYFWSARTPQGAGADLGRVIAAFSQRWHKPRVLLIGYSFGADTLPHMIGQMDAASRSRIASVSLLGLSPSADFQFRLGSWLDMPSADALPTLPAVLRLKGLTVRCIRGVDEDDSACPAIPRGVVQQYVIPGGHHFNRNAALLSQIILGQKQPTPIST
jgi:type IV secretory pathway VirJ component